MKKIGQGWQYTVYDIGNGRVRKVFNSRLQAYGIFLRECFPYSDYPIWKFGKVYEDMYSKAKISISWLKKTSINFQIFGNVVFLNETDYEQDYSLPLNIYLKKLDISKGRRVIDEFIHLNKLLISNEIIDKSFLIGKNYAINSSGDVILIDVGELFIGKEKIENQIKKRPWDHPYVTSTIPKHLRKYFVESLDGAFLIV